MANFDNVDGKLSSVAEAANLLGTFHAFYQQGATIQRLLLRYQANTDPAFNAAINAMFTQAERTELADMLTNVNALVTDWQTNHAGALGLS